jgi:hypothetical protein
VDCERLDKETESLDSLIEWQLGRFNVYQRQVVVFAFKNLCNARISPLVDFDKKRIGLIVVGSETSLVFDEEALYFDINVVDEVLEDVVHFNSRFTQKEIHYNIDQV